MNKKKIILLILVVANLAIFAFGFFYWFNYLKAKPEIESLVTPELTEPESSTPTVPAPEKIEPGMGGIPPVQQ